MASRIHGIAVRHLDHEGMDADLFAAHEQLAWVTPNYVNAVHNDYVQLVIEAGVPGIVVFVVVLATRLAADDAGRAVPVPRGAAGDAGTVFPVGHAQGQVAGKSFGL